MPYTCPKVYYSATSNGTYTQLTGVQSIRISRGRERFIDPFRGSTCTIELIPANSYATALAIGQFLDIRDSNSGSADPYFVGRITDVARSYDMPYNAGTGAAPGDRITITVAGGTGGAARGLSPAAYSGGAAQDAIYLAQDACNVVNVGANVPAAYATLTPSGVQASFPAYSINSGVWDRINRYLDTCQWVVDDDDHQRAAAATFLLCFYPPSSGTAFTFTDDGTTGYKYNGVEFLSSVSQAFGTVIVAPDGLASQAATTGTAPNPVTIDTYDATTAQAANLASYLLTISNQTTPVPFVIRTSTATDASCMTIAKFKTYPVGSPVTVKFRGSTATATTQGYEINFGIEQGFISVYLSASLGTPFTLDSAAFGVLDTNRLGYP